MGGRREEGGGRKKGEDGKKKKREEGRIHTWVRRRSVRLTVRVLASRLVDYRTRFKSTTLTHAHTHTQSKPAP